ncbi:MAG TPA: lipocalin family protein [Anaeromyxobacteraceae bacterium]|nr:lipocalin family protein [Anaeromyxobacteraceae bacterium]
MRSRIPVGLALLLCGLASAATDGFRPAAPGYAWSFPRDHWKHDGYRTEWWYFTGRLSSVDPPGRELGYQLTFFRVGILPEKPALDSPWTMDNLVMVHAAVSDLTGGAHAFSEVLWREVPYLGELASFPRHPLAWVRAAPGTSGRWTLDLAGDAFELAVEDRARGLAYRLRARPVKPIVFQGPGGLSRKSSQEGFASLYYSLTRLDTEGTVTMAGTTWRVRGLSWMDREIGSSQLAPAQVGWDWFALHLADGRDLMLYLLRRGDGSVDFARGTVVAPDGATRWLAAVELSVESDRTWQSPATGATYPARWKVAVPSAGIALTVTPALADQENRGALSGGVHYWEGAVRAAGPDGAPAGEGYVELTGYGPRSRPPI